MRIVAIADIVMSLDNVIAIAAAAETAAMRVDVAHALAIKTTLIIFGLATSIPLIIAGSALLMALLDRYPILVWAGAALARLGRRRDHDQGRRRDGLARRGARRRLHLLGGGRRRGVRGRGRLSDTAASRHKARVGASADRRSAGAGGISAQASVEQPATGIGA